MPNHRLDRMSMLMQLLPVILAQQREGQQNALGQAQLQQTGQFHQGELEHQHALDALGIAQLQQQGEHQQVQDTLARLGITQQGEWHQGELEHQKAMEALGLRQANSQDLHQAALLKQQGQFHGDEMSMHKAAQDQALDALLAGQTNEAAKLGATVAMDKQRQDRQLQQAMIDNYTRLPSATPEGLARLGKNFDIPGADSWISESQNAIAEQQAAKLKSVFGPVYSSFAKDPHAAQSSLNALWQDPTMQSPTVQEHMQPWLQQQNENLAAIGTPSPSTADPGWLAKLGYGAVDLIPDFWNATAVPGSNRLLKMMLGSSAPQVPAAQLPIANLLPQGYGADAYKQYRGTYQQ